MPGKLQNKRSSTLNNPPSTGTLDPGEIALNTHADSANLHFEDASGGVRSIGADPTAAGTYVRNVSGANEVGTWTELEIPPGTIIDTDPPSDPADGQLFFNEDNQTLWVWSEEQSTWAPAVPQVPTGGGGDYSNAELTEKVFFINEQEINEDYTVAGTDNAGSFGPIDIANGKNVTITDGGTWTVCGGAGRSVDLDGFWSRDGSTGTLSPANPGDDIETTGDIDCGVINAAGIIQSGGAPFLGAEVGTNIENGGVINVCNTSGTGSIFRGYTQGNSNTTLEILANGSAKFAGIIRIPRDVSEGNAIALNPAGIMSVRRDGAKNDVFVSYLDGSGNDNRTIRLFNDGSAQFASEHFNIYNVGSFDLYREDSGVNANLINCYSDVGSIKNLVFTLTASGSITTAGDVTVGAYKGFGNGLGMLIAASGQISLNRRNDDAAIGLQVSQDGSSNPTIKLMANGNGNFTGKLTANNVTFRLDPDNPANYVSTTNAEGETEAVYNGPVMNVRNELESLRARATQQDAVIAQLVTALRAQGVQIDTTDIQEGN